MKIVNERIVDVYSLRLMDNGILYVHVSDEKPETIEGLKETVEILGEMLNYKKVPMLNTLRPLFELPSSDVREFWAKNDSCPYISAEAYIINSLGLKILFNFYLKIHKPERPTKIFSNQESALTWLKTFL